MSEPLRLLLIEDNEYDAILLLHELRHSGFEVISQRVMTGAEMQRALDSQPWDAVVSDYNLPAFSAPEALKILQHTQKDLPFIVVSGAVGEQTAVEIMKAGAHDFHAKSNLTRLAEALRREIREAFVRQQRRNAENALRESEERLRLAIEATNDGLWDWDIAHGAVNYSPAYFTMLGFEPGELNAVLNTWLDRIHPDDRDAVWKVNQACIDGEIPAFETEFRMLHKDGSWRWILGRGKKVAQDANGRATRLVGTHTDITDRKHTEEALQRRAREMEALYRISLEINSTTELMVLLHTLVEQAAALVNARMGFLYLLQEDGHTLELAVSHNLPGNYYQGVTMQIGEGLSGRIAQLRQPMMVQDYQNWEGRAKIFSEAPFRRVLGAPLLVKGRVIGVINVIDDALTEPYSPEEIKLIELFADQAAIAVENARLLETAQRELAERRQAETALRESEERFRAIVTGTPIVSFVLDKDGLFTLSEGKGLARLNLAPGQVVGASVFDIYKDYPDICEAARRALAGKAIRNEINVNGIIFDILYTPTFDESGQVQNVVGVASDITERKQAEELLRKSEQSYRGLFNSVAETIYIQSKDGKFIDVNAGALAMYGHPRDFFIGKTPEVLSAPGMNNLEALGNMLALAFAGQPQQFEFWGMRKNGEIFPKDVRISKGVYFGQEVIIALARDITERKKAEQALHRQVKELAVLHQVATAGIQAVTIDRLIDIVTHDVGDTFYPDNFGVLLLDNTGQYLLPHISYQGITLDVQKQMPASQGIAGQVVASGQPRRVKDVRLEPAYIEVTNGIRSELCVPIKIGKRVIGVINAESTQPDFFTSEDERLLKTIAGQLATAMEQIRLFNAERQRRQEAETLREATATISTSLELDEVLQAILVSLDRVVPYDSAAIFLLEGNFLSLRTSRGVPDPETLHKQKFPAESELFDHIRNTREPYILTDASSDPRFKGWGETNYVRGWIGVPLMARGEVFGYITLDSKKVAAFGKEAAALAQTFAHQAAAAIQNAKLFQGLEASLVELDQAYETTIEGWSKAMDLRDKETEGHTLRVTEQTIRLARLMNIPEEQMIHIRRGALLHDIGKMGVPDRILLKPESLTPDEMEIMRRHPQYAYEMLSPVAYLRTALDIPYCHHERWDGSGYPRGLKREEIPLVARMFAVIDVWDALTSDRPYRPAWRQVDAYHYIKNLAGIAFDPLVVEKFLDMIAEELGPIT